MRRAFLECHAGASGDMFLSALVDAGWDFQALSDTIGALNLPPGSYSLERETKFIQGVKTTHIKVTASREHKPRHLPDIEDILSRSMLDPVVLAGALETFRILAAAEAEVHGKAVNEVHFHEIGAVDTIIDIVGTLAGFNALEIGPVSCSPIRVGKGYIQCDHGKMSIPAPATTKLIAGMPFYAGDEEGEFLTPTGAALIKKLAGAFEDLPLGEWDAVGYGSGSRETRTPNYLRLFIEKEGSLTKTERLLLLETNVDDQCGQFCGYFIEKIWQACPLDVYLTPVQMKKNRPGVVLSILTTYDNYQNIMDLLWREGVTLGVRIQEITRVSIAREEKTVLTEFGPVRVKYGYFDGKVSRRSPEYEDCRKIASEKNIPLWKVMSSVYKILENE